MFSFISSILNIVPSVFGYLNKKEDVNLEKYKVDGKLDEAQIKAYMTVAVARANDTTDKWGRRLFVYPTGVLYTMVALMSIIKDNPYVGRFYWPVHAIPTSMEYIPLAVIGYLFLITLRNK